MSSPSDRPRAGERSAEIPAAEIRAGGVRAAVRSRSFAALLAGYAVSAVGDGMAAVGISWLAIVLARGHDTGLLVGAAVAAYTLPGVVAGLGLGRALTRWDPRLLILAEAVLRAASLGLIAAGAVTGILTPAGYVVLVGISSLLGLLGTTGAVTSVAELLPEQQRVAGNSLITVASFAAIIVGPALAGGLIAAVGPGAAGPGAVFGADAGSYVVLIAAVMLSRRFQPPAPLPRGRVRACGGRCAPCGTSRPCSASPCCAWPSTACTDRSRSPCRSTCPRRCTRARGCWAATGPCSRAVPRPGPWRRPGPSGSACGGWPWR